MVIAISRHSWTKTNSFHTVVAGNQTVLHALLICNHPPPLPFSFTPRSLKNPLIVQQWGIILLLKRWHFHYTIAKLSILGAFLMNIKCYVLKFIFGVIFLFSFERSF